MAARWYMLGSFLMMLTGAVLSDLSVLKNTSEMLVITGGMALAGSVFLTILGDTFR